MEIGASKGFEVTLARVGLVAIGRNEGERLKRCLRSIQGQVDRAVYVDSGSTDGSADFAASLGVSVVSLDMSQPFTAARARNAGYERLIQEGPLDYVQFVDGDCEVAPGWLEIAARTMEERAELAVVCGRRREQKPDESIYNRLCDIEWDTPVGEARACGGDAMFRVKAFSEVNGFNPGLIAGEEPELCFRLRARGWKILRIDAEMTLHDAAISRFEQWWQRSVRGGHAFAERAWLHGKSPERYMVRETRSGWLWGLIIPIFALGFAWHTYGLSLLLLLAYPVLAYRVWRYARARRLTRADARLYALFCVLIKFPQSVGQLKFYKDRLLGRRSTLIEYK